MKTNRPVFFASLLALLSPAVALAGTSAFDKGMMPIVAQYELIHQALAGDTSKGVSSAAKKIAKLAAKVSAKSVTGKHAAHYEMLPRKIKAAATKLSKAKGIAKQREAFKELSRPLAMWATMSKPAGINVVFCSMAKGSWLQRQKKIANPYYGAKMLRCGEVVSGQHKGVAGGHMKHGH
jgi:Cu(I)/Ag(I) efflux system membrane fusion protein